MASNNNINSLHNANSSKALQLYQRAQQKLNPGCCSALFTNQHDRIDKAFNLFKESAQLYTLDKQYEQAANSYIKCAEIAQANNNEEDPIEFWEEAMHCYKKTNNIDKYAQTANKCIHMCKQQSKFKRAGDFELAKAELYETQVTQEHHKEAIACYDKGIECYLLDKDVAHNKVMEAKIRKADLMCINGVNGNVNAIAEVKTIYEETAEGIEMKANELYCKYVICCLVFDDQTKAKVYLEKFAEISERFCNSKEYWFVKELVEMCDEEEFVGENIKEYIRKNIKDVKIGEGWKWKEVMLNNVIKKYEELEKKMPKVYEEEDFR